MTETTNQMARDEQAKIVKSIRPDGAPDMSVTSDFISFTDDGHAVIAMSEKQVAPQVNNDQGFFSPSGQAGAAAVLSGDQRHKMDILVRAAREQFPHLQQEKSLVGVMGFIRRLNSRQMKHLMARAKKMEEVETVQHKHTVSRVSRGGGYNSLKTEIADKPVLFTVLSTRHGKAADFIEKTTDPANLAQGHTNQARFNVQTEDVTDRPKKKKPDQPSAIMGLHGGPKFDG